MPADARTRILASTEKLCEKESPEKVTLDEVATLAKVGKGSIYRYFKDKEDLLFQVVAWRVEELREKAIQITLVSEGDYREKLFAIAAELENFFFSHHLTLIMFFFLKKKPHIPGEEDSGPFGMVTSLMDNLIESLMKVGIAKGDLRSDLPPIVLSWFFLSVMHLSGRARKHAVARMLTRELVLDLFMNGAASDGNKALDKRS
jgi:AcrR family transcriptional regulator